MPGSTLHNLNFRRKFCPATEKGQSCTADCWHVKVDLMSEMVNRVELTPDSASKCDSLPAAQESQSYLLLADRGYFGMPYLQAVDAAGRFFIVRGKDCNP